MEGRSAAEAGSVRAASVVGEADGPMAGRERARVPAVHCRACIPAPAGKLARPFPELVYLALRSWRPGIPGGFAMAQRFSGLEGRSFLRAAGRGDADGDGGARGGRRERVLCSRVSRRAAEMPGRKRSGSPMSAAAPGQPSPASPSWPSTTRAGGTDKRLFEVRQPPVMTGPRRITGGAAVGGS